MKNIVKLLMVVVIFLLGIFVVQGASFFRSVNISGELFGNSTMISTDIFDETSLACANVCTGAAAGGGNVTPHILNGTNHTGTLSALRVVKDSGTNFVGLLLDVILDKINESWNESKASGLYAPISTVSDNTTWNQSLSDSRLDNNSIIRFWNLSWIFDNQIFDGNASSICGDNTYLDGNGLCINFNDTVNNLLTTVTYLPWNFTLDAGIVDDGNLTSIQFLKDDDSLNISEAAGANPMTLIINFTNVTSISELCYRVWYEGGGGHEIAVGLYHCTDSIYEEEFGDITDMSGFAETCMQISDPSNHVCNGNTSLRFRHIQNGIGTHDFRVDRAVVIDGAVIGSGQHDATTGRDNCATNHPDALCADGSRNATNLTITGDLVVGDITLSNFVGVNCTGTNKYSSIYPNGTFICSADQTGSGGNSSWNQSLSDSRLDNLSIIRFWNLSWVLNNQYQNETERVTNIVGFNCTGTDKYSGTYPNGTLICTTDEIGSGGNTSWNQSLANTLYADISVTGDNTSWNESKATSLYSPILWGYNHTLTTFFIFSGTWNSTFNATYAAHVEDNQTWNESKASGLYQTIDSLDNSSATWVDAEIDSDLTIGTTKAATFSENITVNKSSEINGTVFTDFNSTCTMIRMVGGTGGIVFC